MYLPFNVRSEALKDPPLFPKRKALDCDFGWFNEEFTILLIVFVPRGNEAQNEVICWRWTSFISTSVAKVYNKINATNKKKQKANKSFFVIKSYKL